jgi:hypothetical protein
VLSWIQSHPALSATRMAPLVVLLAFMGAAASAGVVVASGNLVLMGLALGAILGVLLLNAVGMVVWMILVGTLLITGPVAMHFPQLGRVAWLFSILGFFLIGAAILYEGTNRNPHRPSMPPFVLLSVLFVVYAIGMLFVSEGSVTQAAAAIKRYFQYWGLMFALATVPFTPKQVRRWLLFLLLLGLIQFPFALYQRVVLMPIRLNMPNSVVPVDIVAGTFEGSITGGANNNVMALLLLILIAGLVAAYRDSVIERPLVFWPSLATIVFPLAIGETKLAAVLLPVALAVVCLDLVKKRPFAFLGGALLTVLAAGTLMWSYVALQANEGRAPMTLQQKIDESIEYNFGSRGYFGGASLNRGNVIPFWWEKHGTVDPLGTVVGHGIGASAGATGGEFIGQMDRKYPGYAIGLTAASGLLWDVGLFGFMLIMMIYGGAFFAAASLVQRASPGLDRAMCRTLQATVPMLGLMLFAVDLMLFAASLQVLTALTFGLIAWRWRISEHIR